MDLRDSRSMDSRDSRDMDLDSRRMETRDSRRIEHLDSRRSIEAEEEYSTRTGSDFNSSDYRALEDRPSSLHTRRSHPPSNRSASSVEQHFSDPTSDKRDLHDSDYSYDIRSDPISKAYDEVVANTSNPSDRFDDHHNREVGRKNILHDRYISDSGLADGVSGIGGTCSYGSTSPPHDVGF